MNICFTKNCNLLVSYYDKNMIDILNCYDLKNSNSSIDINNFVKNIEDNCNKKKNENKYKIDDNLVWNEYNYNNNELVLLFENKIVRGSIKNKKEQTNLEYYY